MFENTEINVGSSIVFNFNVCFSIECKKVAITIVGKLLIFYLIF